MINTVLAHSSPIEHKEAHEISSYIGISVVIIMAILYTVIYRDKK